MESALRFIYHMTNLMVIYLYRIYRVPMHNFTWKLTRGISYLYFLNFHQSTSLPKIRICFSRWTFILLFWWCFYSMKVLHKHSSDIKLHYCFRMLMVCLVTINEELSFYTTNQLESNECKFEFIGVLCHMQRYFSNICDGTDVQADWTRSCTYGRAPNAIEISQGSLTFPSYTDSGLPFYTVISRNECKLCNIQD